LIYLLRAENKVVNESQLRSNLGRRLLVWSWYRVGNRYTADAYLGKFYEVLARIFAGRRDGALIAVAAPYEEKEERAAARLQSFLDQMLPSIEKDLDRVMDLSTVDVKPARVRHIPNEMEQHLFRPSVGDRPELAPRGFIPPGGLVIGMAGRLAEVKDQPLLGRAFAEVLRRSAAPRSYGPIAAK
jgi:glycosyltransferase involved in cell wall biosynthesis